MSEHLRLFIVKLLVIVFLYRNKNNLKVFSTKLPVNRKPVIYKLCSILVIDQNTVLVKINR